MVAASIQTLANEELSTLNRQFKHDVCEMMHRIVLNFLKENQQHFIKAARLEPDSATYVVVLKELNPAHSKFLIRFMIEFQKLPHANLYPLTFKYLNEYLEQAYIAEGVNFDWFNLENV